VWEEADETSNVKDQLVVEIRHEDDVDWSEYLSVHHSSQSTQIPASSQPPYCSLPASSRPITQSQRTIPDSQEEISQDTGSNRPASAIESLEKELGLSSGWSASALGPSQEPSSSIPSHQFDPLRIIPDSQSRLLSRSVSVPLQNSQHSACIWPGISASQSDKGSSSSDLPAVGLLFSQLPKFSPSTPSLSLRRRGIPQRASHRKSQSSYLSSSDLRRPTSKGGEPTGSSQRSQPLTSQLPAFGAPGTAPKQKTSSNRNSPLYFTQPVLSLPSFATSLTPINPVAADTAGPPSSVVPETVLRHPASFDQDTTSRGPCSPRLESPFRSPVSPTRKRQGDQALIPNQHSRRAQSHDTAGKMSEAQQAGEMSATEALLDVHRQFVSSLDTSALVPDAEGASGLPGVNIEHDAAALEMEAIDGQAGHLVGSMTETDNPASLLGTDAPLFPPSVHVVGTDAGHLNDFATPTLATVAPAEVTSLPIPEVEALLAPPSEVQMSMELPYTSGRRLPHQAESTAATQDGIISGPPTATDIAETASSSSGGESPDIASFPLHTVADPLSKEYLVTLPFSSNRRHLYLEKLNRAKSAIGEYGLYFQSELTPDPKVSSVYQIDKLFAELINICDLPDTLERSSVEKMTQKELQKLCVETNAKFAFIYDLLMDLQDSGGKVLIIARSDELLCYLESLLIPEGFAFSRQGLDQMQHVQTDSVKVVLARQNQELVDTATDFDIVIGFDFEFKQSTIAREIASSDPSTLPYVFSLVIGHSIEHLDIHLTTKNPGMDLLYRKNGLAIMLWKTQPTIADPPGYWKPYAIAKQLASLVRQTGEALLWRPMEIPEHVVQIYLDPPSGEPNLSPEIVIADSNTKKRKLVSTCHHYHRCTLS